MIGSTEFPRLTAANHRVTSPATPDYNCIAWSTGDSEHWWQPGVFWPIAAPADDFGIGVLERAFVELGYSDCGLDVGFEPAFEKVALYGSGAFYSHAARQLPTANCQLANGANHEASHLIASEMPIPKFSLATVFIANAITGLLLWANRQQKTQKK